ncbi:MAG: hypothetical protein ACRC6E_05575 [Fusobacteriaceae bacterium]
MKRIKFVVIGLLLSINLLGAPNRMASEYSLKSAVTELSNSIDRHRNSMSQRSANDVIRRAEAVIREAKSFKELELSAEELARINSILSSSERLKSRMSAEKIMFD